MDVRREAVVVGWVEEGLVLAGVVREDVAVDESCFVGDLVGD